MPRRKQPAPTARPTAAASTVPGAPRKARRSTRTSRRRRHRGAVGAHPEAAPDQHGGQLRAAHCHRLAFSVDGPPSPVAPPLAHGDEQHGRAPVLSWAARHPEPGAIGARYVSQRLPGRRGRGRGRSDGGEHVARRCKGALERVGAVLRGRALTSGRSEGRLSRPSRHEGSYGGSDALMGTACDASPGKVRVAGRLLWGLCGARGRLAGEDGDQCRTGLSTHRRAPQSRVQRRERDSCRRRNNQRPAGLDGRRKRPAGRGVEGCDAAARMREQGPSNRVVNAHRQEIEHTLSNPPLSFSGGSSPPTGRRYLPRIGAMPGTAW